MKTIHSVLVLSLLAAACGNVPQGEGAPPPPAAPSGSLAVEQALADVDTGKSPEASRASLGALLADPTVPKEDRARVALALATLDERAGRKDDAVSHVEEAIALGNDDAEKRLRVLLTGSEGPSPWARRAGEPIVAPSAVALSRYFPAATPDRRVEIEIQSFGTQSGATDLGTFAVGDALRQKAIESCGICDEVRTSIHTHSSSSGSWSAIPRYAPLLENALVVLFVDQETMVPARYAKWLAVPSEEIQAAFDRGEGLVAVKERPGAPPLVTLAAPRPSQLLTVEAKLAAMSELPKTPVAIKLAAGISPQEIRSGVRARFGAFRQCYDAFLGRKPGAGGKVEMSYAIRGDGSLDDVRVALDPALDEPELRACTEKAAASLRYPRWSKDASARTTVKYPIVFSP
jgi:hypothetical protein